MTNKGDEPWLVLKLFEFCTKANIKFIHQQIRIFVV